MSVITIVGAGLMGTAMCRPATDNGHAVRLVGTPLDREIIASVKRDGMHPPLRARLPESLKAYQVEELDEALAGADLVVGGVSSFGVDWFAETVLPKLKPGGRVISVTKGLRPVGAAEEGRLSTFPDFLGSVRSDVDFLAIGGPCISFGLFNRRQTVVCFCGRKPGQIREIRALFATPYYHIVPTTDVTGLESGVALKNAYSLGVSLAVGIAEREAGIDASSAVNEFGADALPCTPDLNPGFNPQAALFGQSCVEMRRLVALLGGNPDLISGPAGAGDLYVTIFGGRTRRLGTLLGRGLPYGGAKEMLAGVTLESVSIITRMAAALRARAARGEVSLESFPLLMHLDAIINQGAPVSPDWDSFGSGETTQMPKA